MNWKIKEKSEMYPLINVYGRNKGNSEEYEAKSKTRRILLNDETVSKYKNKNKNK